MGREDEADEEVNVQADRTDDAIEQPAKHRRALDRPQQQQCQGRGREHRQRVGASLLVPLDDIRGRGEDGRRQDARRPAPKPPGHEVDRHRRRHAGQHGQEADLRLGLGELQPEVQQDHVGGHERDVGHITVATDDRQQLRQRRRREEDAGDLVPPEAVLPELVNGQHREEQGRTAEAEQLDALARSWEGRADAPQHRQRRGTSDRGG